MAIRSRFFDSVDGDRIYTSLDFANFESAMQRNGIIPVYQDELNVEPTDPESMQVLINQGALLIEGRLFEIYDQAETLEFDASDLEEGEARRDAVSIRLDRNNREIRLEVVEGTAGEFPPPPSEVDDGIITDYFIREVRLEAGQTTITEDDISFPSIRPQMIELSSFGYDTLSSLTRLYARARIQESTTANITLANEEQRKLKLSLGINQGDVSIEEDEQQNLTRLFINETGVFSISLNLAFDEESAGFNGGDRAIWVQKAGSDVAVESFSGSVPAGFAYSGGNITFIGELFLQDINTDINYYEFYATQDSGQSLEIDRFRSGIQVHKVADNLANV